MSAIRPPGRRVPPQRAVIRGTTVSATGCEAAATVWATSWPGSVVFAVRANVPSARVVPAAICCGAPPGGVTVTWTGCAAGGVTAPESFSGFP